MYDSMVQTIQIHVNEILSKNYRGCEATKSFLIAICIYLLINRSES